MTRPAIFLVFPLTVLLWTAGCDEEHAIDRPVSSDPRPTTAHPPSDDPTVTIPRIDPMSQQRIVIITTEPKGAPVYVVPDTIWSTRKRELMKDAEKLDEYAAGERDPGGGVRVHLMPYKYVALMRRPNGELSEPLEFVPQGPNLKLALH